MRSVSSNNPKPLGAMSRLASKATVVRSNCFRMVALATHTSDLIAEGLGAGLLDIRLINRGPASSLTAECLGKFVIQGSLPSENL